MIPGWIPENLLTGGIPFEGPLPVQYSGRYSEGGDGIILGSTEIDFIDISVIFEQSFIVERFGYGFSPPSSEYARILTIDLVQAEVFGVLLLDGFTPPAIANEFFEFRADTQDACVGGLTGSVPIYGVCQVGSAAAFSDLGISTPTFTEQS